MIRWFVSILILLSRPISRYSNMKYLFCYPRHVETCSPNEQKLSIVINIKTLKSSFIRIVSIALIINLIKNWSSVSNISLINAGVHKLRFILLEIYYAFIHYDTILSNILLFKLIYNSEVIFRKLTCSGWQANCKIES